MGSGCGQTSEVLHPISLLTQLEGYCGFPRGGDRGAGQGKVLSSASLVQQCIGGGLVHLSTLLSRDLNLFLAAAWQCVCGAGSGAQWLQAVHKQRSGCPVVPVHAPCTEFGVPGCPMGHKGLCAPSPPLHLSPPLVAVGAPVGLQEDDAHLLPGLSGLRWAGQRFGAGPWRSRLADSPAGEVSVGFCPCFLPRSSLRLFFSGRGGGGQWLCVCTCVCVSRALPPQQ